MSRAVRFELRKPALSVTSAALAALLAIASAPALAAAEPPPPGRVPPPKTVSLGQLDVPYPWAQELSLKPYTPLVFHVDLDLVAPLGDGKGNLATWLRDFAKPDGKRLAEYEPSHRKSVLRKVKGWPEAGEWRVFAADHPLLLEAEPWMDQATCRFYPDVFSVSGPGTPLPNLLFAMQLGKSWIARGFDQSDPAQAKEDFRRVVRLGRLLRQDDVTLMQDLIGLALIRLGSEALYRQAQHDGDAPAALIASLVLHDGLAQRLESMARVHAWTDATWQAARAGKLEKAMGVRYEQHVVDNVVGMSKTGADRRFRFEAALNLWVIQHNAGGSQAAEAKKALDALASDPDPVVAAMGKWYQGAKWNPDLFEALNLVD